MQENNRSLAPLPSLLLPWYAVHARQLPWRQSRDPYPIWISEIMLQQTRVEAVIPYFNRFLHALPHIAALAAAPLDQVLKLWEGLGYYSRARNLHRAAQVIMAQHGGVFPTEHTEILKLPGIGAYTAGAVASICFEAPTPAVDGNVLRVITRYAAIDNPIDEPWTKKEITRLLAQVYPSVSRGDFTQSLIELGAIICPPNSNPKCDICPLASLCVANQSQTQMSYPVKLPKKPRKIEERTVFLLQSDNAVALERRPERGLLAGMWQLPNLLSHLNREEAESLAAAWMDAPCQVVDVRRYTHIFTHVEWHLLCYIFDCVGKSSTFTWVEKEALERDYAIPTPFRKFMQK